MNETVKITVDVRAVEGAQAAVDGLKARVNSLGAAMERVFAKRYVTDWDKQMLILRLSFGKLQNAIADAAAQLGSVLVPWINRCIYAMVGFFQSAAKVIAALFGTGDASKNAAAGQDKLASSLSGSGRAAKKALAAFDEIERLEFSSSGGGSVSVPEVALPEVEDTLSPKLQAIVDKIKALLEPIRAIDLTPAAESLERLKKALEPITKALFAGLEWAWYNILAPLAKWSVEEALPAFLDTLTAAVNALDAAIEAAKPALTWLWDNYLQPLAKWAGDQVVGYLEGVTEKLEGMGSWIQNNQGTFQNMVLRLGAMASNFLATKVAGEQATGSLGLFSGQAGGLGSILSGVGEKLGLLGQDFSDAGSEANAAWGGIQSQWGGASDWLNRLVFTPIKVGLRSTVNGIIGILNALFSGIVSGLNTVIRGLNRLSVTIPAWVPGYGGKGFSFNLQTISTPSIPRLAQGAVLPANKPFLAMVGDQRHGTNVEAPLATIQEAVAAVMGDYEAANLAGHEATVAALKELLGAVLSIEVGDDTIGAAARRYDRRRAIITGG